MFCTKCGNHNLDDAQICRTCSAPLVRRESSTAPLPAPPPTGTPPGPTLRYADPPRPAPGSPPVYGSPGSHPPAPAGYQPYQSGYANYTPPMPQSASGRAIASMILSLVSLVAGCGPFTSVPGMILGKMEMNAIRDGQAPRAGEVFAKVGFYFGLVVTALTCLAVLIALFFAFIGALN